VAYLVRRVQNNGTRMGKITATLRSSVVFRDAQSDGDRAQESLLFKTLLECIEGPKSAVGGIRN
jgi:hypothetical protein